MSDATQQGPSPAVRPAAEASHFSEQGESHCPGRRTLDFDSFDRVIADVRQLEQGYARAGNWSLGECCDHLARFMRFSIEGFPARGLPAPLAWIIRSVSLNRSLRTRRIPAGVPAPRFLRPVAPATPPEAIVSRPTAEDHEAAARLVDWCKRVKLHGGEFARSPLFGKLSPATWRDVHLIHAAHHLSFLIPHDRTRA